MKVLLINGPIFEKNVSKVNFCQHKSFYKLKVLELAEPNLESSFFSVAKNFLSLNTTENSAKFFQEKLLPLFWNFSKFRFSTQKLLCNENKCKLLILYDELF